VSASVSVEASGYVYSGAFSGSMSMVNQDISHIESEREDNTGSTITYVPGTHQIWLTEKTTVLINNQKLVDSKRTYVESPVENWNQAKRVHEAKQHLKNYYGTDGSSAVERFRFSVPPPW